VGAPCHPDLGRPRRDAPTPVRDIHQNRRLSCFLKAVVLFTDGVDTTSRHATYSSTLAEARESDGAIYTVAYDTSRDLSQNSGQRQIPWPGGRGGISIGIPFPGSGGVRGGPGGAGRGPGGSSPGDYRRANDYLHELAQESGGRYYRGETLQEISQAFVQVPDELRRQYSLGYYPTPVGQPGSSLNSS
jgi:Ca-activated chloride channel family protein